MIKVNLKKKPLIRIALITANKYISMQWKDEQPPTSARWTNELALCIPNEKIIAWRV